MKLMIDHDELKNEIERVGDKMAAISRAEEKTEEADAQYRKLDARLGGLLWVMNKADLIE